MVRFRFWRARKPGRPKDPPAEAFGARDPMGTIPTLSFELRKGQELKIDIAGHNISLKPLQIHIIHSDQKKERLLCEITTEDGAKTTYALLKGERTAIFLNDDKGNTWVIGVSLKEIKSDSSSPVFVIEKDMIAVQVE